MDLWSNSGSFSFDRENFSPFTEWRKFDPTGSEPWTNQRYADASYFATSAMEQEKDHFGDRIRASAPTTSQVLAFRFGKDNLTQQMRFTIGIGTWSLEPTTTLEQKRTRYFLVSSKEMLTLLSKFSRQTSRCKVQGAPLLNRYPRILYPSDTVARAFLQTYATIFS